ncbi:hypothetical protein R1sor_016811 [Riccia sorocarpa]|uniref:DDE Tnp4 domain-containing protein n=1 Tax=Riccia sorocarpa TaxID=122646 RepID=A0ABD3HIU6_9MARC
MPRESDRHIIGKQLTKLIELNILDEESSSSNDSDLEMLDLLSTDDESGSSGGDSDRDPDLFDNSDSEGDDEIGDLAALMDAVEQSKYLTRSQSACLDRSMLMWGLSHGSVVNYTNRVMTTLESAMGHKIAWLDRQERAINSAQFAELGFPGCIGLVDSTLVKLSQRPRDDGETYLDKKMLGSCHNLICLRRSSLWGRLGFAQLFDNGQYLLGDNGYIPLDRLVCSYKRTDGDMDKVDFNTYIAHARVGNEHCIGILKARWHSLKEIRTQLRNPAKNAYVIRWKRCCIILHNFLIRRRNEWSEDDHPIEVEREDDLGPPPQATRECNRRGLERRRAVQRTCLEINTRPGGVLC